jgi:DNA polymerase-3 subunit chi
MSEIRFYHAQRDTVAQALPVLLLKAIEQNMSIMVKVPTAERRAFYDDWLWRFDSNSFLPHGQEGDAFGDQHPVWLTTQDECPNNAQTVIAVEGAFPEKFDHFQLVCALFDNYNPETLQIMRQLWVELRKNSALQLTYYKQQPEGNWVKQDL